MAGNLESGQTLLLENLRFHPDEEANDPAFAKQLAELCDIYVNDAFGSAHRAHASTEGITHFVKQKGASAAGLLMEKELNYLGKAVTDPDRPSSPSSAAPRSPTRSRSSTTCSTRPTPSSSAAAWPTPSSTRRARPPASPSSKPTRSTSPKPRSRRPEASGVRFLLPVDHVLADKFAADAKTQIFSGDGPFPAELMALDIGPKPSSSSPDEIADAATIIWNGPMGVFEMPAFAKGTNAIAHAVAKQRRLPPPSSAAETRSPQSNNPASPTRSPTSPPAAEPPSNSSKAKSSPASPPSTTNSYSLRSRP